MLGGVTTNGIVTVGTNATIIGSDGGVVVASFAPPDAAGVAVTTTNVVSAVVCVAAVPVRIKVSVTMVTGGGVLLPACCVDCAFKLLSPPLPPLSVCCGRLG